MGNVEEQVKELIAGILNVSAKEVTEDTAIGDIAGWDSLHHLQILSGIEKHFNIRFKNFTTNNLHHKNTYFL